MTAAILLVGVSPRMRDARSLAGGEHEAAVLATCNRRSSTSPAATSPGPSSGQGSRSPSSAATPSGARAAFAATPPVRPSGGPLLQAVKGSARPEAAAIAAAGIEVEPVGADVCERTHFAVGVLWNSAASTPAAPKRQRP
jgi:hypothetical protein